MRSECDLVLLVDMSGKLLNLSKELGLCCIVGLLLARPLMAQSQPALDQTQKSLILCDGQLEILSDPLLANNLSQDLNGKEASH